MVIGAHFPRLTKKYQSIVLTRQQRFALDLCEQYQIKYFYFVLFMMLPYLFQKKSFTLCNLLQASFPHSYGFSFTPLHHACRKLCLLMSLLTPCCSISLYFALKGIQCLQTTKFPAIPATG